MDLFIKIQSLLANIDYLMILAFSGIFFVLFLIAELGYHYLKIPVGYTRKFVHVVTGIIVMYFPIYFKKPIDLIIICVSFFVVLSLSKRLGLISSINAINRKSRGSTLYPLVVIICYMVQYYTSKYSYFLIPILILALADPAAEFFGRKFKYKPYSFLSNEKTVSGSLGFFFVALITAGLGLYFLEDLSILILILCALVIAITTTTGEALSIKGYDNLVIPLSAMSILYLFGI